MQSPINIKYIKYDNKTFHAEVAKHDREGYTYVCTISNLIGEWTGYGPDPEASVNAAVKEYDRWKSRRNRPDNGGPDSGRRWYDPDDRGSRPRGGGRRPGGNGRLPDWCRESKAPAPERKLHEDWSFDTGTDMDTMVDMRIELLEAGNDLREYIKYAEDGYKLSGVLETMYKVYDYLYYNF